MSSLNNLTKTVCLPGAQGIVWETVQSAVHMANIYLCKQINQLCSWTSAFDKRLNPPDYQINLGLQIKLWNKVSYT